MEKIQSDSNKKQLSFEELKEKYVLLPAKQNQAIVIDTDEVRKDMPGYKKFFSALADKLFKEALAIKEYDTVFFTGGGPGSGKTEIVARRNLENPIIIFEGLLGNYELSKKRIQMAIDAGKKLEVNPVYIDIESALIFAQNRPGRKPLSRENVLKGHRRFRETLPKLLEEFPEIAIRSFENKNALTESLLIENQWKTFSVVFDSRETILNEIKAQSESLTDASPHESGDIEIHWQSPPKRILQPPNDWTRLMNKLLNS